MVSVEPVVDARTVRVLEPPCGARGRVALWVQRMVALRGRVGGARRTRWYARNNRSGPTLAHGPADHWSPDWRCQKTDHSDQDRCYRSERLVLAHTLPSP